MARVSRGVTSHARHRKVVKLAKGVAPTICGFRLSSGIVAIRRRLSKSA